MPNHSIENSQIQISNDGRVTLPLNDFVPLLNNAVAYTKKFRIPEINLVDSSLLPEGKAREYLKNCSTAHLYQLRSEGKILSITVSRKFFYLKSSLDTYLRQEKEASYEL